MASQHRNLVGYGFPYCTASFRGWRGTQPPIQGVAVIVERHGVRVYALTIAKKTKSKSVILNLFEDAETKPVRIKVEWPGWGPGVNSIVAEGRHDVFLRFEES